MRTQADKPEISDAWYVQHRPSFAERYNDIKRTVPANIKMSTPRGEVVVMTIADPRADDVLTALKVVRDLGDTAGCSWMAAAEYVVVKLYHSGEQLDV